MPRILLILTLMATVLAPASSARAADQEPTVVTITGAIGNTNRGPFDAFRDALFGVLDSRFDRAHALTLADLRALPQTEIDLRYPNWPATVTFRGPLLQDVLALAGPTGNAVAVQAVDGYAPEFTLEEVRAGRFVLALEADGEPLAIGGHGPAWLVFPQGSYDGQSTEDDSGLAWAVFHIRVLAAD